jgi:hypothetical protein
MSHPSPPGKTTLVAILGASEFPRSAFEPSPAFEAAASKMLDYFLDPDGYNLDHANYIWLFDYLLDPSGTLDRLAGFITDRITVLKQDATSVSDLIIYYVGHGGFDEEDEFFLATRTTNDLNKGVSSIRIRALATTITNTARWLRTTLILDACFSAAAAVAFQSELVQAMGRKIDDAPFPQHGVALLAAASKSKTTAVTPQGDITMFTKALLAVLRYGERSIPQDQLRLDDVHALLVSKVNELFETRAVRPELHEPRQTEGFVAKVPLYPNRAVIQAREIAQEEAMRAREKQGREVRERAAREKLSREQHEAEEQRRQQIERAEQARLEAEAKQRATMAARSVQQPAQDQLGPHVAEAKKVWDRELDQALIDRWLNDRLGELELASLKLRQEADDIRDELGTRHSSIGHLSENLPIRRRQGYTRSALQPNYEELKKYKRQVPEFTSHLESLEERTAEIDAQQAVYRDALSGALRETLLSELRLARRENRQRSFATALEVRADRAAYDARRASRRKVFERRHGRKLARACLGLVLLVAGYLAVVLLPWAWRVNAGDLSGSETALFKLNAVVGTILLTGWTGLQYLALFLSCVRKTDRLVPMPRMEAVLRFVGGSVGVWKLIDLIPWTWKAVATNMTDPPRGLVLVMLLVGYILSGLLKLARIIVIGPKPNR